MYLPSGQHLTDPEFQIVLLHEISHFVTPTVLKTTKPASSEVALETVAKGFDREPAIYTDERGIFEEGLGDLFALYVLNENLTDKMSEETIDRMVLTMSLLKVFAKKRGIPPVEAFKKVFKGKVLRDLSVQKELVDIFGTNVVRGINNIDTFYGKPVDQEKVEAIAKEGEFLEDYQRLKRDLDQGRPINYPGIPGHFIKELSTEDN